MAQQRKGSETHDAAMLSISIGTKILVEPAGMGDRFKSDFVGMVRGSYLIVKVPRIPGLNDFLYVEKPVTVRYLHEGQVYGFGSEVVWNLSAPYRLLFLKYPKSIESLNLRKAQRVDCFLPIELGGAGSDGEYIRVTGMMLNLSAGGCQLVLDSKEDENGLPSFSVDEKVELTFTMMGTDMPIALTGKVKNISLHKNRMYIGLMFQDMDDEHRQAISSYVENVTDYLME